jgi:hypothetical protein
MLHPFAVDRRRGYSRSVVAQAFDIDAVARDAMRTRHIAVELGKLLSGSA